MILSLSTAPSSHPRPLISFQKLFHKFDNMQWEIVLKTRDIYVVILTLLTAVLFMRIVLPPDACELLCGVE